MSDELPRHWLGVCGWPIRHSRSPEMQNAALRAAGLRDWRYMRLPLPRERFADVIPALAGRGFMGVNVTIPHKEAALEIADEASALATAIGAANTLTFARDGTIHADNTDAPGLLDALPVGHAPSGCRALVLGAGGSARAVVHALAGAGARLAIWNRSPARAEALAARYGAEVVDAPVTADIIVNCTSVGLDGDPDSFKTLPVDADHVGAGTCVVDLVYRDGGTPLLSAARAWGADTVDGREMLVAQGAVSFERWTGRPAPRQAMRRALDMTPHP
jgi:shikimate dehydrogenase